MKNIINYLKNIMFIWISYLVLAVIIMKGGYYGFHINPNYAIGISNA